MLITFLSSSALANIDVNTMLEDYKKIQSALPVSSSSPSCGTKEVLRIFVSFSMPESLLVNLDQQARKIGAKLVIRGLKNNSFKETFEFIKSIDDQAIRVDIDPKAFTEFGITQVPSFVLNSDTSYDKITGNVSLSYVLKEFADSGDLPVKAAEYLRRLGNENK
jgi:conjugal transfer pilus assembly protein TrbC